MDPRWLQELHETKALVRDIIGRTQPAQVPDVVRIACERGATSPMAKRAIWYLMDNNVVLWGRDRLLRLP